MKRHRHLAARVIPLAAALVLASCPNVLMNEIKGKINADTGKDINSFSLMAASNTTLYMDVHATINDSTHTISITVPKWVPLTNLVASFQFQGASVSVNGVAQTSGMTPQNFSAPLTYTVTPASGAPVTYTVTAVTGTQGLMGGVIQGTPLTLSGAVTTVAGQASLFGNPMGIAQVGSTLYVSDQAFNVIWKVDANSGTATVFAGMLGQPGFTDNVSGTSAQFDQPEGLATDGTNLYVADEFNERIRQIVLSSAAVTTLAGQTNAGEVDGTGGSAKFNGPNGLYYDSGSQLLYETDRFGKTARTISTAGVVTTIIGSPSANPSPFAGPAGLTLATVSTSTYLFVADENNNVIYQFGPLPLYTVTASGNPFSGIVYTANGSGSFSDGTATAAYYYIPTGIAVYNNFLYVTDNGNHAIRKLDPSNGSVATAYGVGTQFGHVDANGGTNMRFDSPNMLCVQTGTTSYMYVTENGNNDIRSIQLNTPFSGKLAGVYPGSTDGTGSAARLYSPRQMVSNGSTLWIGDQLNQLLRSMALPSDAVGTAAGQLNNPSELNGTGTGAAFNYPAGITEDAKSLYICDQYGMTIRKMDIATGVVTTFAGSANAAGFVNSPTPNQAFNARFSRPVGITTDGTNLYVADLLNNAIRQIVISTGVVTTLAGLGPASPGDMDGSSSVATFNGPNALTTDGTNLYVSEASNNKIRQVVIATGAVSTIAGPISGTTSPGYKNATGNSALFRGPIGITTDGTNLYVADQANDAIRQIVISTGVVTTLAGAAPPVAALPLIFGQPGETDNTGTSARFNLPIGITTDGTSLYVSDRGSNTIRRIQ
jgi:hypothetical protein